MLSAPNSIELTKQLCGQFRDSIKRLENLDRNGWVVGLDSGFFYTGPKERRFGGLQEAEVHETVEDAEATAKFLKDKFGNQAEVFHKANALDLVLGYQRDCLKKLEGMLSRKRSIDVRHGLVRSG